MSEGEVSGMVAAVDLVRSLGVTKPRLLRYLKSPEFAPHVAEIERKTATGTRTVIAIPITIVPALKAALHSENGKQERERERVLPLPAEASEQTKTYLAMLTARADERIAEQAVTIADLRRDKEELKQERERLRSEVLSLSGELSKARQLAAFVDPSKLEPGGPESVDTAHTGVSAPSDATQRPKASNKAANDYSAQNNPRKFWEFWKPKEGG